ncbi:hypothetical protein [Burkholderia ubonensis]|uniref:hypothetical protein n=1 Tax=Burkholderia ubonensis TaxID=101571 RepID=UPI000B280513|nr:hypothetical protein [Burkholderia ubonensis]
MKASTIYSGLIALLFMPTIAFEHYNEKHPHSALKYRSPREFRRSMDSATLV